jgi:DUF4097 and DUF4098 domain-containing protein YvlB
VTVTVRLGVGLLRIVAGDRDNTAVTVTPGDARDANDIWAVRRTRVEMGTDGLTVETARPWTYYTPFGRTESVNVLIEVPSGSALGGSAGASSLDARGTLGDVHFRTGAGDITLEAGADVWLRTGAGSVRVGSAASADVNTAGGEVHLDSVEGSARLHSANGSVSVGRVAGDLTATSSAGPIRAERTDGSVTARTSFGPISLGEVSAGTITARTPAGSIDIAVRDGVHAELDLTATGPVRNDLEPVDHSGPQHRSVNVRATTGFGAIAIHRVSEPSPEVASTATVRSSRSLFSSAS